MKGEGRLRHQARLGVRIVFGHPQKKRRYAGSGGGGKETQSPRHDNTVKEATRGLKKGRRAGKKDSGK